MPELERELRELAAFVEFPAERDLAPSVVARIEHSRPGRGLRRGWVLAVAAVVLALAVAFAVPPARTAILRFLHIQGATVTRVPKLPHVPKGAGLDLGRRTTLEAAQKRLNFPVLVPSLGEPDDVYFDERVPGGMVSLVYGSRFRLRLLASEFLGGLAPELIQKTVPEGTRVERVNVRGEPGIWIAGGPHVFMYADKDGQIREESVRLSGNALIWQYGRMTLRLEGEGLTKAEALRIASTMR
jgi:hypothetical protein